MMTPTRRDALALTFASLFPLVTTFLYFVVFAGGANAARIVVPIYSLSKLLQFSFPIAYVFLFERDRHPMHRPNLRGLPLALGFAVLVDVAMFVLYFGILRDTPWLLRAPEQIRTKLQELHVNGLLAYLGLAFFVCVIHAGLEEYYWRWFVFGWMRRYLSFPVAAVLAGLAFMAHHVVILVVFFPDQVWTLAVPLSLAVAVGGIVWAWFYERTGSLLAAWICHGLIDAGIMVVGYEMIRTMW